jgi:hypothetical protein
LPALVRLLGDEHWSRDERGSLNDRAERVLLDLHASGNNRDEIYRSLEAAQRSNNVDDHQADRIACAAAKLLISLNAPNRADAVGVLVNRGLCHQYWHDEMGDNIAGLLSDLSHRDYMLKALINGLNSGNKETRRGCAKILRRTNATVPPLALLLESDESDEPSLNRLHDLLNDSSQRESTTGALADALWDDDHAVAWRSASALVQHEFLNIPGLAQAIVRSGLCAESRRPVASGYLDRLRTEPARDLAVRAALLDGLRSSDKKTACASGLLLIVLGEARGEDRVARITASILRDPEQVKGDFDKTIRLLAKMSLAGIVRAAGEYFGGKELDSDLSVRLATVIMEEERLDTPNLARGLVLAGLADKPNQKGAILHLERLLDDSKRVVETRKALSAGLASTNSDVAWGCAGCLWKAGGRTDPGLAAAIARVGLGDATRRDVAKSWLVQLLANSRTTSKAISAVDEVASNALNRYRSGQVNYDHAWELARCVLEAGLFQSEQLVKALIVGGFGRRERHDEVLRTINALAAAPGTLAIQIDEELWSAVSQSSENSHDQNEKAVRWGAARCLVESERPSVSQVLSVGDDDIEDRGVAFLRTIVRESSEQVLAATALRQYLDGVDTGESVRKVLVDLLRDEDAEIAHAAACQLVAVGEIHHRDLPVALIRRGTGWYDRKVAATQMLDELRQRPLVGVAVMEALQQALWATDHQQAWSAAVYLMDGGNSTTPGLARALAFAGFGDNGFGEDAETRLHVLLENPLSRPTVLDALRSSLLRGRTGRLHNVASLLVLAGEPLHKEILAEFDSEHIVTRWPFGPLSALVLSGRVPEARETARKLGFSRLLHLLKDDDGCAISDKYSQIAVN